MTALFPCYRPEAYIEYDIESNLAAMSNFAERAKRVSDYSKDTQRVLTDHIRRIDGLCYELDMARKVSSEKCGDFD